MRVLKSKSIRFIMEDNSTKIFNVGDYVYVNYNVYNLKVKVMRIINANYIKVFDTISEFELTVSLDDIYDGYATYLNTIGELANNSISTCVLDEVPILLDDIGNMPIYPGSKCCLVYLPPTQDKKDILTSISWYCNFSYTIDKDRMKLIFEETKTGYKFIIDDPENNDEYLVLRTKRM